MTDIDVSKIPADVMATVDARMDEIMGTQDCDGFRYTDIRSALTLAILTERAACAQHAFAMRWAPATGQGGTKNAILISQITKDWSQKIGMGILNR